MDRTLAVLLETSSDGSGWRVVTSREKNKTRGKPESEGKKTLKAQPSEKTKR
jgi:hypothetical protein